MPIRISWDDDAHTVIRRDYIGDWTLQEAHQATDESSQYAQHVRGTYHLIFNFSDSIGFPTKILSVAAASRETVYPNQGLVIGVKLPSYLQALAYVAGRIYPELGKDVFFVDSLDAARALIADYKSKEAKDEGGETQ